MDMNKNKKIEVRVTEKQHEKLVNICEKQKLNKSELLRKMIEKIS